MITPSVLFLLWISYAVGFYVTFGALFRRSLRRRILAPAASSSPPTFSVEPISIRPVVPTLTTIGRRRRARWFMRALAGLLASHVDAWIVFTVVHPENFGARELVALTLLVAIGPLSLHVVSSFRRSGVVGASGRVWLAVAYGLVFALFTMTTFDGGPTMTRVILQLILFGPALVIVFLFFFAVFTTFRWMNRIARLSSFGVRGVLLWGAGAIVTAMTFGPGASLTPLRAVSVAALLSFASMTTYVLALRFLGSQTRAGGCHVLFLRTLVRKRGGDELLRRFAYSWAEVGCIDLLTGSDSALATSDADSVVKFVTGRLGDNVLTTTTSIRSWPRRSNRPRSTASGWFSPGPLGAK